jgi:hypothetical protein
MTNLTSEVKWEQAMAAGKTALANKRLVEATRLFMVAERHLGDLPGNDIRLGATKSWMAVGYYKLWSFALAEAFFRESMELLELNLTSPMSAEIAVNLKNLIAIYVGQGRKGQAMQVRAVITRHLVESGYEGALTVNFEPPAPRSLFEVLNGEGDNASRAMSRLIESRKLRQLWGGAN